MAAADPMRHLAEALLGKAELTAEEIAAGAGFTADDIRRLWQSLGFPPVDQHEPLFTRADIETLHAVRHLMVTMQTDSNVLTQMARVTGQSLAKIADAQVTTSAERFHQRAAETSVEEALDELGERSQKLVETFSPLLSYVWRRHLLAAVLRLAATPTASDRTLTIGFADLVGFTALSQTLEPQELAATVDRFEALAYDHVVAHGGRIVKMIGDEVMFSIQDGKMAAEIGLALAEAIHLDETLEDIRIGLASGPVLAWEGDLFGPTVNLASRLVGLANPGTVLLSEDLGQQLREEAAFTLRHLRPTKLQGIGRVRAWVLRRAPAAPAAA